MLPLQRLHAGWLPPDYRKDHERRHSPQLPRSSVHRYVDRLQVRDPFDHPDPRNGRVRRQDLPARQDRSVVGIASVLHRSTKDHGHASRSSTRSSARALPARQPSNTRLVAGCKPDRCSGTSTRGQRKLPSFVLSPGASALPSLYPHLPRLVTGVRATLRPVTDRDARCAPRLQCRMLRIGHAAGHPARRWPKR